MAENYIHRKENVQNVQGTDVVCTGWLDGPVYAAGAYVHELKQLNEDTIWRRTRGAGSPTLPTVAQPGPDYAVDAGDRVAEVCFADTEYKLRDPRGKTVGK